MDKIKQRPTVLGSNWYSEEKSSTRRGHSGGRKGVFQTECSWETSREARRKLGDSMWEKQARREPCWDRNECGKFREQTGKRPTRPKQGRGQQNGQGCGGGGKQGNATGETWTPQNERGSEQVAHSSLQRGQEPPRTPSLLSQDQVQFSSVTQSCPALCDPMDCSTPGLLVHHQLHLNLLKWQPTPVFLPGESQGRRGLVGFRLWGRTESDTAEAT